MGVAFVRAAGPHLRRRGQTLTGVLFGIVRGPGSRRFEVEPEKLGKLAWEMPTMQAVALFGVSPKAVEKRCKKYEIWKPPRGYWAKANAGSLMAPYW